jgi:dihydroorotase
MVDVLVAGGRIVTSAGEWFADIGIREGRIEIIAAPGCVGKAAETIDARGLHVLPGLVDGHVHFRDPGFTEKEDFRSGTMAAAAGGVTTTMAIPNTNPPLTTADTLRAAVEIGRRKAVVDFALFGGACIGAPDAVESLAAAGAIAYDLYDDPFAYPSAAWLELFERVQTTGLPLCFYLHDRALQNYLATQGSGLSEVDRFSALTSGFTEVLAIARILSVARRFTVPVVLRMVTTAEGLRMTAELRRLFPELRVAVETCVHYLFLTADDFAQMGTRALMRPPLRPRSDLEALWRAAADGTTSYIATDHAPQVRREPTGTGFLNAPPGIIGLETVLPLLLNARAGGRLTLQDIARLCCDAPARIYGLYPRKGTIAVGADADLVLVDLARRWQVNGRRFYSRGDPGPFDGWELTGRPMMTLVRGRAVMVDGKVDDAARGQFVRPDPSGSGSPGCGPAPTKESRL